MTDGLLDRNEWKIETENEKVEIGNEVTKWHEY